MDAPATFYSVGSQENLQAYSYRKEITIDSATMMNKGLEAIAGMIATYACVTKDEEKAIKNADTYVANRDAVIKYLTDKGLEDIAETIATYACASKDEGEAKIKADRYVNKFC